MSYPKYDCQNQKPHHCQMDDYDDCEMPCMKEKPDKVPCFNMCADLDKMKCKTERECIKTYKTCYKLYRVCEYRLYKICPCCCYEFEYHRHRGICPKCGASF
jgi:hypothetical protein